MNNQILDLVAEIMRAVVKVSFNEIFTVYVSYNMNEFRVAVFSTCEDISSYSCEIDIKKNGGDDYLIQQLTDCLAEINKLKGK